MSKYESDRTPSRRRFTRTVSSLAAAVLTTGVLGLTAPAASAEVDLSGERITILVPFNEGGGTDSYARFLAPFYEKHLPGNPKILVLNKSGAGGIIGTNYFDQRAEKDGTWVYALSTSTVSNFALKDPRIKFNLTDYRPFLLSPRGTTQYVRKELGLQDIDGIGAQLKAMGAMPADKLIYGGKTPTSQGLGLRVALSLLGVEVKSVWGMKGNGPMALAFERGEFTVNYDNTLSYKNNRKHLIEDGTAVALYTFGVLGEDGSYQRDPELPDVPSWYEAYRAVHGKDPSGPEFEAFEALFHMSVTLSKSLHLPPGTPDEVYDAYLAATRAIIKDPDFIAKRKKIFGDYPQTVGGNSSEVLRKATSISPEARKWLADFVKQRYDVDLRT